MSLKKWSKLTDFPLCYFCINNQNKVCALHIQATSRENVSSGIFDQVRFKPACSATESSYSLEILDLVSIGITLSRQRKTKMLIRLRACAGWFAPLLFAYAMNRFSHDMAHLYFFHLWDMNNHDKVCAVDIPATSHENVSLGIFDQVWFKPACSATEAS